MNMPSVARHLLAGVGLVVLVALYLVDARIGWVSLTALAAFAVAQNRRALDPTKNAGSA